MWWLLAGGATAVAVGLSYLLKPGRTVQTAAADLQGALTGALPSLAERQQRNADIIASEFDRAGFGWLVPAAIVNAYAESRLDELAIGDEGASVGLFQLHEQGAGEGLSVEQRQDPTTNARRILEVVREHRWSANTSHRQLAVEFAHYVERCAACGWQDGDGELQRRDTLTERMYGDLADAVPLRPAPPAPSTGAT